MDYTLTKPNVDGQLRDIREQARALTAGLDAGSFNWQPDGGKQWSIGQCLDHLSRTAVVYGRALETALADAPPQPVGVPARPNLLGRLLVWVIEPPVRIKAPARAETAPASALDPAEVMREFNRSLDNLSVLAHRAVGVDAGRTRYANPLAGGSQAFNIATGIMVMLAHNRRHLEQAERVRERLPVPPT
jgi:hypothetical protein